MSNESSDHHFGLAVNVAIEALKSLLFLNGGAATALIALTNKTIGSPDFSRSILAFGLGVWCSVLALIFGYFSQLSYANGRFGSEYKEVSSSGKAFRRHVIFQYLGLAFVILSLLSGTLGMFLAYCASK